MIEIKDHRAPVPTANIYTVEDVRKLFAQIARGINELVIEEKDWRGGLMCLAEILGDFDALEENLEMYEQARKQRAVEQMVEDQRKAVFKARLNMEMK